MAQEREQERRKRNMREALEGHSPMQDMRVPPTARIQPPVQPQSQPQERPAPEESRSDALQRGMVRRSEIAEKSVVNSLASGEVRSNLRYLSVVESNDVAQPTIVASWLGADYLSLAPTRDSPDLRTEHQSYFDQFVPSLGVINGIYSWGTKDVHVSSDIYNPADRMRVITHEDLHFFSRGGREVSWGGVGGGTIRAGYVRWLNEGLTELFAQQVTRDHGEDPSYVAYPHETSAALYLQTVVSAAVGNEAQGRDILLTAYLTGNFTQVRVFVDLVLGPGTFDRFMAKDNGAEALAFIESKVAALGDTSMLRMRGGNDYRLPPHWADNPVLNMARMQLGLERSFSALPGARTGNRPLGRD